MVGKLRTIRYTETFDLQAERIGNIRNVDDALFILTYAISRNPDPFPNVPGFGIIKIAKTDPYIREGVKVPSLRVWFRQIDENVVELLAIEEFEKTADE